MKVLKNIFLRHFGELVVIFFSMCLCVPARAGLLGDTVSLTWYYPNLSTVYEVPSPPTAVVGVSSPTFPSSDWPFNTAVSVNVTDYQITIIDTYNGGCCQFAPAPFNGYVITDLTHSNITSVVVAFASPDWSIFSTNPASVLSYTSNSISANFEGLPAGGSHIGDTVVLDVYPTPEPGSLLLLASGMIGAIGAFRKKLAA